MERRDDDDVEPRDGETLDEARARKASADASLAELKLAAARAELLDADTVRRVYADVGAATREAVMALEVEAATELDEHGLTWLQGALRRALEQASADAERLSAALDGPDDDTDEAE
jgi:chaperonin cofactor prefoldin